MKIFRIISEIMGDDAEGLYVNSDVVFSSSCGDYVEDYDIITNINNNTIINIKANEADNEPIHLNFGMTKLVINLHNFNFVIKVPYSGTYYYDVEEDKNKLCSLMKVNVCDMENELYEKFSDSEVGNILLPSEYVGTYNNIPIYAQKKIDITGEEAENLEAINPKRKTNNSKIKIVRKIRYNTNSRLCFSFINNLINEYGISKTENILSIISNSFSDLHSGNYGVTKNNKSYIFDYAGYEEDWWNL